MVTRGLPKFSSSLFVLELETVEKVVKVGGLASSAFRDT